MHSPESQAADSHILNPLSTDDVRVVTISSWIRCFNVHVVSLEKRTLYINVIEIRVIEVVQRKVGLTTGIYFRSFVIISLILNLSTIVPLKRLFNVVQN